MTKQTIKIGIMSREEFKQRTIAIAKGEYKPEPDEPKIWVESRQILKEGALGPLPPLWELLKK